MGEQRSRVPRQHSKAAEFLPLTSFRRYLLGFSSALLRPLSSFQVDRRRYQAVHANSCRLTNEHPQLDVSDFLNEFISKCADLVV